MTTTPPEPPPSDGNDQQPPPPPAGGYGQQPPPPPPPAGGYGAPPPPGGYGAPPPPGGYAAPPQPGYAAPAAGAGAYADWLKRAQSALVDWFGPSLVVGLLFRGSSGLGFVLWIAVLAWAIYNAYLGGQTGQSYGKKWAGTRLILESTGMPPGGGLGIGRYFVHILDALPCYLGFLWPIWDAKRQTFADKLLKTVVVLV